MNFSDFLQYKAQQQSGEQDQKITFDKPALKFGFDQVSVSFKGPGSKVKNASRSIDTNNDGIISAREMIENEITEIPMLWGHLLQKSGIAVLAGSSDTGKSTLLRQLSLAIVTHKKQFLGFDLKPEHNRVIYISTEDDVESLSPRFMKEYSNDADIEDYENLTYIFNCEDSVEATMFLIQKEYKRKPADCIIIDTWGDFADGDQNTAMDARRSLKRLRNFALEHKCLFIVNHHLRKSAMENDTSKNNLLGSQSIEAKARVVLMLTVDPYDFKKRRLTVAKGNYIPDDLKQNSLIIQTDDNFIFEYHSKVTNTGQRRKNSRYEDNKAAIARLLAEGKSRQDIIKTLDKIIDNAYEKSMIHEIITSLESDSSTSTE